MVTLFPFKCAHPRHVQFAIEKQITEAEIGSTEQVSADAEVEQSSSSETQQVEMLQVSNLCAANSLVEPESCSVHSEQSWWSSN